MRELGQLGIMTKKYHALQVVGSVLHGVAECRADIAIGCGGEDFELLSHGRSSRLHVGDHGLNLRIAGIDRERKARISVQELM